jgi:DNA-binding NtrC family response regulator
MTAKDTEYARGERLRVLMLEDSPNDAGLCLRTLHRAGYHVHADIVSTYDDFARHLDEGDYDVILADYQLPTWTGLKALELLDERGKETPFVLVTGYYCEDTAREVLAKNSRDYLLKSQLSQLPSAIRRLLRAPALAC